jgi:protein-tyrosine phosphatase
MQMFEIPHRAAGRLWIMPCPEGHSLARSVQDYRLNGADHIVSMLTEPEAADLGLEGEAAACQTEGLGFTQHPIADFGLPDPALFDPLIARINQWLVEGQGVAVHCRAGIGRSGMVTTCVLAAQGLSAAESMAVVTKARGISIPDTVEQGKFIATFTLSNVPKNPRK